MRLLFVCTGNQCRSPVAQVLAEAWAEQALGAPGPEVGVQIQSAGLEAATARPMATDSAAALTRYGVTADDFRSRPLTPELAARADLVITMTRGQRGAVLAATPRGLRRTFTLREAADLLDAADLSGLTRLSVDARARELGRRLDAARPDRRGNGDDDIPDPMGRPAPVHQEVADAIASALRPLVDFLVTGRRPLRATGAPA